MPEITRELLVVTVLVAIVLVQTVRLARSRSRAARTLAANRRQGADGEHIAERVLLRAGYIIETRQPAARLTYIANGVARAFDVRADLLVSRDAERYVAEVKSGEVVSDLSSRATRRQLLEYTRAFDVDTVLLVDAERETITKVRVPTLAFTRPAGTALPALIFGALLGAIIAVIALDGGVVLTKLRSALALLDS